MFAVDRILFIHFRSELFQEMNKHLKNVSTWFTANKRCLGSSKNPSNMSHKRYLMNKPTPFSVFFLVRWPMLPWLGKQYLLFLKKL